MDSGYEQYPVVLVSWFGAIMFCNWLTEMRDDGADNVVYKWIDDGVGNGIANDGFWQDEETTEDVTKNGYRLPGSYEWEYAARYRGSDTTNVVTGIINGINFDTMATKWTRGDSPSGAVANSGNVSATGAVAWYWDNCGNPRHLHEVKGKRVNHLGLYDMSGNVWEWCFSKTEHVGTDRIGRSGGWYSPVDVLEVGYSGIGNSTNGSAGAGFRLCRSK